MEPSPFPGSSKRAKAPDNITQVAHCLVDGCNADLSLCRDYHRRHKVCEVHSKTAKVTIGGREQRFCQQCSRFHSLVEFDDGKRSCRKRLDGHNRRRRKPQPDSLTRTSGLLFSNQQGTLGTRLLSFSNPEMLLYNNQQPQQQLNYIERPNSFPKLNQFQFMQGSEKAAICQPLLDPNADARSSNCSQNIYSDGLNQVVDSDRALSLLSSAPPVTMEFGLVQTESFPQAQSLVQNFQCSDSGPYRFGQESKPVVSSMDYPGSSILHLPQVFEEGSSTSGSH